jgi:hypothetical protein
MGDITQHADYRQAIATIKQRIYVFHFLTLAPLIRDDENRRND